MLYAYSWLQNLKDSLVIIHFGSVWKNVTVVSNLGFVEVFIFFLDALGFVLYNLPKA